MSDPTLVFDIETIPDLDAGRRLYGLDGLGDADVAAAMAARRLQDKGNDFQPHHLHKIVAISVALASADQFKVWSLGNEAADEAELVGRFFEGIERYRPQLVSWNGGGFDLPVLHYRALRHGISAPAYWDTGGHNSEFKWNNYLGRYHWRHLDLMDVLSLYQPRATARLDEIAQLLGFPGKLGMDGSQVLGAWLEGRLAEIRAYCETDVLNTYLVFLRFQRMRGQLSADALNQEQLRVRTWLAAQTQGPWAEFLAQWPS